MTNKEINEYLAENMFGLIRQKDFGEWNEHDFERDNDGEIDDWAFSIGYCNGPVCQRCYYSFCKHCVDNYQDALKDDLPCVVEAPDYISDFKQVLDKAEAFVIKNQSNLSYYEVYFNGYKATNKDLGKAICLAAIKWLREKVEDFKIESKENMKSE